MVRSRQPLKNVIRNRAENLEPPKMPPVVDPQANLSILLDLPFEIREAIWQQCFGPVPPVIYIRAYFKPNKHQNQIRQPGRDAKWFNHLEWRNPCPQVMQINRQIYLEAYESMLKFCVLDLWGAVAVGNENIKILKSIAANIKNVAVSHDRLPDYLRAFGSFKSLKNLFIDVPQWSKDFISEYNRRSIHVIEEDATQTPILYCVLEKIRQQGQLCKLLDKTADTVNVYVRTIENIVYHIKGGETTAIVHEGVVPRFEYKFPSYYKQKMLPPTNSTM